MKKIALLMLAILAGCSGGGGGNSALPATGNPGIGSAPNGTNGGPVAVPTPTASPSSAAPGGTTAFSPGSQLWLLTSGAAAQSLAADPTAIAYFARPHKIVLWPQRTGVYPPSSWHTVPWVTYTSFAQFQVAVSSGTVPASVRAVMYDCENWLFTPMSEQIDPVSALRKFAALAHARGYLVIAAPGIDIMSAMQPSNPDKWGAFEQSGIAAAMAPMVDIYHIQSQRLEQSLASYVSFTQTIEQQVRAANPNVLVTAGVTTNMNGASTTPQQIASAVQATSSMTNGYWLNVPSNNAYDPSGGPFNPAVASAALSLLP